MNQRDFQVLRVALKRQAAYIFREVASTLSAEVMRWAYGDVVWTSKDGTVRTPAEIGTPHLRNIVRLLNKVNNQSAVARGLRQELYRRAFEQRERRERQKPLPATSHKHYFRGMNR